VSRPRSLDTIVVGAGQAGLSAGFYLQQRSRRFVILDADDRVGDVWRRRWESLRLITPAGRNGLPGMPFPGDAGYLPTRDEVAAYLEHYAREFRLPIEHGTRVHALHRNGSLDGYRLQTSNGEWTARSVIVATGGFQRAKVPGWAASLSPDIRQIHASAYRTPAQVPDGPVLVVGAGNSGVQIALELADADGARRPIWLSGPDTGTLPRRVLGRDVYHWIWPLLSIKTEGFLGRFIAGRRSPVGHPRVGVSTQEIIRSSITRVGRTMGTTEGRPWLEDGRVLDVRTVIWCSGYRPDFSWIHLPIFRADGTPDHRGGVVPAAPGLAFLGLPYQRRLNSGLIGGVGADAAEIVAAQSGAHGDVSPLALAESPDAQHRANEVTQHDRGPYVPRLQANSRTDE
jgi:putative flavoprotein involved in K+ transport